MRPEDETRRLREKQLFSLLTIAFMVTLGVWIGMRLSNDPIAVLVGTITGIAASIPCVLWLMRRF